MTHLPETTSDLERESPSLSTAPEFSVIVSCYNEEHTIEEFYSRLTATMAQIGRSYEIVFVNDGSLDGTGEHLRAIFDGDSRVIVIELCANAGQWPAISAGFAAARGKHFVIVDSDLEVSPEDIPKLLDAFDKGAELVSGVRQNRSGPLQRRMISRVGNFILYRLLGVGTRDFGSGFKIIRGDIIRRMGLDSHRPFYPLVMFADAKNVVDVPVQHSPRRHGRSGWTLGVMLRNYGPATLACYEKRHALLRGLGLVGIVMGIGTGLLVLLVLLAFPGALDGKTRIFSLGSLVLVIMSSLVLWLSIGLRNIRKPTTTPLYAIRMEHRH